MLTHTVINGSDIKLLNAWRVGFINESKDSLLILELADGTKLNIGMPPQVAIQIGHALKTETEKAIKSK